MVDGEVAVRVSLAPVHQPEPRPPLDDLALLALRTGDTGRLRRVLLDVLAVRVPGAAHERPEATELALQRAAALRTGLVEHLRLGAFLAVEVADVLAAAVLLGEPGAPDEEAVPPEAFLQAAGRRSALLDAAWAVLVELLHVPFELLLRPLERVGERRVELTQHLHALQVALGDLVEVLLHLGREVHVDDVGEVLDELVGHDLTDVVGEEPAILEPDVAAVLDRRDDRRVGRRPADAQLLERLDERRLGEARGGCVKCCSGRSSRSDSACSAESSGSRRSPSSSAPSSRPSAYTRRCPSKIMVRPLARNRYRAVPALASMSTPTWLNRACAICVATVRCQISVYRRSWSRSRAAATRSGVRRADVGRIASCASCAFRDFVLNRRGSDRAYSRRTRSLRAPRSHGARPRRS